jgi:hypothetical protein
LATSNGFGREHGAEDADDEIEGAVLEIAQVCGVAFLKLAVREPCFFRAAVACFDEVRGNINSEHVRAESGFRQCGGSIAAAEIKDPHALATPSF